MSSKPVVSANDSVLVPRDRLELVARRYNDDRNRANRWRVPAAGAGGLWIDLAATSFDDTWLGVSGSTWETIFLTAAIALSLLSVWLFVTSGRNSPTVENLLAEISSESRIPIEDRALFVVKVKQSDSYRILVYRDRIWKAYLLPHMSLQGYEPQEQDDPNLISYIGDLLALNEGQIRVTYVPESDLNSVKHSAFHKADTTYRFRFFLIHIQGHTAVGRKFRIGGREFEMLTLDELESDPETYAKNLDITRAIADNRNALLHEPLDSVSALQ